MPERTFFFPEPIAFHIWGTLRAWDRHLKSGKARRWYQDLQLLPFHTCSILGALLPQPQTTSPLGPCLLCWAGWIILPERAAVQYLFLSAEFSMWPWLAVPHSAETPCSPASAANAAGGQQLPLHVVPWPMLCAEGGRREGCPSLLFKDLALLKYHLVKGEAFVLGGEICWVCLEWFCTEWYIMGKQRVLRAVPRRASTWSRVL